MLIEDTARPDEVEAVRKAFAEAGFDVEVEAGYGRKGVDVGTGIVVVLLFSLKVFAEEALKDGYVGLKRLRRNVSAARRASGKDEGDIVFFDDSKSKLVLASSLPDEAIDALRYIDWSSKMGSGDLHWDSAAGRWRDRAYWVGESRPLDGP